MENSIPRMLPHDSEALQRFTECYPRANEQIESLFRNPDCPSTDNLDVMQFIAIEAMNGSVEARDLMSAYLRVLNWTLYEKR